MIKDGDPIVVPVVSRLRGDLIDKLKRAKVSTLEEFRTICKVGTKLESEDNLYEIIEIKADLVRVKQISKRTSQVGNANFSVEQFWTYFRDGRLYFGK